MPAGRPLEYNEEYLNKAKKYLSLCEDKHEVKYKPATTKEGNLIEIPYVEYNVKVPTIEGLAVYMEIHKDTVYDWEDKYSEFSDVIANLRSKQADALINKGLSGDYNPTIAKVLLTKHGYREGVDTDLTSKGEKITTTSPEQIAIAQKYEEEIKKGL